MIERHARKLFGGLRIDIEEPQPQFVLAEPDLGRSHDLGLHLHRLPLVRQLDFDEFVLDSASAVDLHSPERQIDDLAEVACQRFLGQTGMSPPIVARFRRLGQDYREPDGEGALVLIALDAELAAHEFHEFPANGQSEPGTAVGFGVTMKSGRERRFGDRRSLVPQLEPKRCVGVSLVIDGDVQTHFALLGELDRGFYQLMHFLAEERLLAAVGYVGAADAAFDITMDYIKERKVFGQRIADFQNTRFKMADMRMNIDVAQAFVDQCVEEHNLGELTADTAAKAKLFTSELEGRVMDECVQLHGGAGYMDEYPICRMYLNARVSRIYAGSSEVMREIIARSVGLDPRKKKKKSVENQASAA